MGLVLQTIATVIVKKAMCLISVIVEPLMKDRPDKRITLLKDYTDEQSP